MYGPLGLGGLSSTTSPEIGGYLNAHPRVRQLTWSETATNRMLFEAGFGAVSGAVRPVREPRQPDAAAGAHHRAVRGAAGCPLNGGIPNLTYRSANWSDSWDAQYTWRASVCLRHRRAQPEGRATAAWRWCRTCRTSPTIRTSSFTVNNGDAERSSRRACCRSRPAIARATCRSTCRISGRAAG